jgi:hypothetical protein
MRESSQRMIQDYLVLFLCARSALVGAEVDFPLFQHPPNVDRYY